MLDNSSRKDSNDEIWSRGSITGSSDYTSPSNFFSFDYEKLYGKTQLFRYEQGGTLVYLSNARIAGDLHHPTPNLPQADNPSLHIINPKLLENVSLTGNSYPDKKTYLEAKKLTPKPQYREELTIEVPKNALKFNSKFESGNLNKAIMISESLYNLYLEKEPGNVCLQWYYFEVRNKKPQTVTFRIVNLGKFESLYNEGMKPLIRSVKDSNTWKRSGTCITYSQNSEDNSYTLSFTYSFTHSEDSVFFAYSYPYTYTDLLNDIEKIANLNSDIARVDRIGESLCGNSLYMITITEDVQKYFSFAEEKAYSKISGAQRNLLRKRKKRSGCKNEYSHKKGIFITARVHPGETVSSFMMQGVIDFLVGGSRSAQILRKNFVFKLIPMLNPDGVRYGKTRVSMVGADLNRRWAEPHPLLHPCIFAAKRYLKVFSEMHECLLFCDFHGHSIKKNVFFYGCNEKPIDLDQGKKNVIARVISFLLSKRNKLVSYKDSRFRMEKNKESTARISIYRQFGIVNSLTLEASFYGPSSGEAYSKPRSDLHMLPEDLRSIGRDLCLALFVYLSPVHYVRTLQNISRNLRDPALATKPVAATQDSTEEETKPFNFHKDIINCEEAWIGLGLEYSSEQSSNLSASDIEELSQEEYKKPEKPELIRKPYKAVTPPRLNRRPTKPTKTEKSEINLSPEAYFKMPGISVFSFNLRAKSSELLRKDQGPRSIREKTQNSENETKISKLTILNTDCKIPEKAESSRVKIQSVEHLHKSWLNSKSGLLMKPSKSKRSESKQLPSMLINRFPTPTQK